MVTSQVEPKRVEDLKLVLWTEHQVVDDLWKWEYSFLPKDKVESVAAEALAKLAKHPQWWARYYVAEIMRRYPPFRTDELIQLLAADPDESVCGVIEQISGVKVEPQGGGPPDAPPKKRRPTGRLGKECTSRSSGAAAGRARRVMARTGSRCRCP